MKVTMDEGSIHSGNASMKITFDNKVGDLDIEAFNGQVFRISCDDNGNAVLVWQKTKTESDMKDQFNYVPLSRLIAMYEQNESKGVLENISSNLERIADAIEDFNRNSFYKRPGKG